MQHNLCLNLRRIGRISLAPIVTHRIGENGACLVEARAGDHAPDFRVALEPVLGVLVPEVVGPVAAGSAEGAVYWMEGDGVDAVHVRHVTRVGRTLPVAFEGKVEAARGSQLVSKIRRDINHSERREHGSLPGVLFLDVLYRAPPLDAPHRKPAGVGEAADDARLPLQRALQRLVELGRVVEADDVDVPVRRADDQQLLLGVERVHPFLAADRRDRRLLAQVPVLDRLVPRPRHQHRPVRARHVDEAAAPDGFIVRGHLGGGRGAAADVEEAGGLVGADANGLGAVLNHGYSSPWTDSGGFDTYRCPATVQDRSFMLE